MNGFVAEGPGANFFYEKDGVMYTAPGKYFAWHYPQTVIDIVISSNTRSGKVLQTEDLYEADSAFFCGTAAEITPIESIEGQTFQKPWTKSQGSIIQQTYQAIVLDKSLTT